VLRRRNPLLEPSIAATLELTDAEIKKLDQGGKHLDEYKIFVPPSFGGGPAKISLLFAVGTEMGRHGLRTFFDGLADRILIAIPGIEVNWGFVKKSVGRAWGVGIDKSIIDDLLGAAGVSSVSWRVDVLACYSTGYRGLNGTINNFARKTGTLDLTHVSTLAVYDALYRGDQPSPGANTERALAALETATASAVSVAVYEVTTGGVPRQDRSPPGRRGVAPRSDSFEVMDTHPARDGPQEELFDDG